MTRRSFLKKASLVAAAAFAPFEIPKLQETGSCLKPSELTLDDLVEARRLLLEQAEPGPYQMLVSHKMMRGLLEIAGDVDAGSLGTVFGIEVVMSNYVENERPILLTGDFTLKNELRI